MGLSPCIWQHFWGLFQSPWPILHLQGWEDNTNRKIFWGCGCCQSTSGSWEGSLSRKVSKYILYKTQITLTLLSCLPVLIRSLCFLYHFPGIKAFFFFLSYRVHKISVSEMRLKDSCVIAEYLHETQVREDIKFNSVWQTLWNTEAKVIFANI